MEVSRARKRRKSRVNLPEPASISAEELNAPVAARKGKRERRPPTRYTHDPLPGPPPPLFPALGVVDGTPIDIGALEAQIALISPPTTIPSIRRVDSAPLVVHETERSDFGVIRRFSLPPGVFPTHDPDQLPTSPHKAEGEPSTVTGYGPVKNRTAFLLAEWYWSSTKKSFRRGRRQLEDHIKSLGANKDDLNEDDTAWTLGDGWTTTTVTIDIPFHKRMGGPTVKPFTVGEFRHRSIVSIIKEKLSSRTDSRQFHYYPYEATWKRTPDSPDVELYGDLYFSRAFRDEHERIQQQAPTYHNKGMKRVVVALMFWSDATQLTSFGGASLWPCYLFFGNEAKKPKRKALREFGAPGRLFHEDQNKGKLPSDSLFSYCVRELFHKQWSILLSPDLVEAMEHGIIIQCPDRETRCFFPRIFSYSADYPEKVLVGGIRNNGVCPCHRCLVKRDQLFKLGAPSDTERMNEQRCPKDGQAKVAKAQVLINQGYAVDSKKSIEAMLLQPTSLVPLTTAFERNLSKLNFNILSVLVVDILHEFEIGVWKRLYIHLLRLLDAFPSTISLAAELDARYRAIPAFGRDTIRKFPTNCAIPAFELLLSGEHNERLTTLLFICAQWHALAKLRLHNDFTLALLDYTTTQLGAQMRHFYKETCLKVATKERKNEAQARARQEQRSGRVANTAQRATTLSIFTIKFHFLGDYTAIIRQLGTTDSYSTQTGELYHREPKSWYPRTDRKDYQLQLSHIERRKARLSRIRAEMEDPWPGIPPLLVENHVSDLQETKSAPDFPLYARYDIGMNKHRSIDLDFFARNPSDPHLRDEYLTNFVIQLKQHLFPRILDRLGLGDAAEAVPEDQWIHVVLRANRIHAHRLLRVNYTTYDVRREQDVLHVDTPQCNFMTLNDQYEPKTWLSEHPYTYGKLLGVFHADVSYVGLLPSDTPAPRFHRIDFAWVHWYSFIGPKGEFSLDRVSPRPITSHGVLEFIDPSYIIRSVHLIPQFSQGKEAEPMLESRLVRNQPVWKTYFINRFVDRDMFMRYQLGMAVGHAYTHTAGYPPPRIPTIPPDFDHYTDVKPAATPATSTPTQVVQGASHAGSILRHEGGMERRPEEVAGSPTAKVGDPNMDEGSDREDEGEDEGNADYIEELDDREMFAYTEMYGV
ncbi:hypothetical protein FA13DRAFT_1796782 [Coprinellus micaceus]|uniref:Uncharacterized protein n=1 Tax=Coprinellus micaceus TaxID=71717 RepID=A0A4Y7SSS5_COPMI|nr:hypothetical protein FA13DRAFT_1796782 [Coprinellus micaceus]